LDIRREYRNVPYSSYGAGLPQVYPNTDTFRAEGEKPSLFSNSTIYPICDRSDPATSPSDPVKLLLNTIGGGNWKTPGQWIEWEFEADETGLYKIAFRARQNLASGVTSTRRVTIDGQDLFEELSHVAFPYDTKWYTKTLGNDGGDFSFYFEKGTHTIRLECVTGEIGNAFMSLRNSVYLLNDCYRKIIMVTGTTPDPYRDYQIWKDIPELLETFAQIREDLEASRAYLNSLSLKGANTNGILETLILQLDGFIKYPDNIVMRIGKLKDNISSLSAWLLVLCEQPLEIDFFDVVPANRDVVPVQSNFLEKLIYNVKCVVASFSTDYRMVGDFYDDNEVLTVWVGMGRDQVQVIKDLVDNDFVPRTGIRVNVNLVQQGLIEATLAGKGPDISLFTSAGEPVNLAARGALVDLTQFPDYADVKSRFMAQAFRAFTYMGGVYALPATQTFPMLFYRKDVFGELGVDPPKTWNDIYKVAPVIQRKNLNIGIGSDLGMFATLLFQRGGEFYSADTSRTNFNTEPALEAFTEWTDFFTKYGLPLTYDFQNRFRTGEMPLGIAPYTMYNLLSVAAPEIKDLWEMIPLPATVGDDGALNTSVCGGSQMQSCIMFTKTKDKNAGWEFLKWFTEAGTQTNIGIMLENQLGPAGRYATANVEALRYLPWDEKQLNMLYEQWETVKEIPETTASYYVSRSITNAFRKVVYKDANPRHTLNLYSIEMDKELRRKLLEFGVILDD
jgi:ABC-type glycerol-3-phosphate transport system substrate-binding protein